MLDSLETRLRRLLPSLGLAAVVLGLDRASKAWALRRLAGHPPWIVLDPGLRLELAVNPGAAFGVLDARPALSIALGVAWLSYLLWLGLRPSRRPRGTIAGVGLLLGGSASNLYDRAFGDLTPRGPWDLAPRRGVIDFIVVDAGRAGAWPAFNVADVAAVAGAVVLLVTLWRTMTSSAIPDRSG